ncbi:MAG TPA: uroporphyrinogen-III synthase [Gemmatimonadaceae bacterium]|nr:uroporphyrinogen-III synthase [Gemmatimonadaceae bacterium]
MSGLAGVRVAVLESRRSAELAQLIRRQGGEPWCVPALVEEVPEDENAVHGQLEQILAFRPTLLVAMTGGGVQRLHAAAHAHAMWPVMLRALHGTRVVARGPKPAGALRALGVSVAQVVPSPYTTAATVELLGALPLGGARVVILHAGEHNPVVSDAVRNAGATVLDVRLYRWALPAEYALALRAVVAELVDDDPPAIAFTAAAQVQHLLAVADAMRARAALVQALRCRVLVAAVGPTCAEALRAVGVEPQVVPTHPKMGPMVVALARYAGALSETSSG